MMIPCCHALTEELSPGYVQRCYLYFTEFLTSFNREELSV